MSERINFGTIKEGAEPPNLIELQTDSYKEFLQEGTSPSKRKETGLQAVFREVFPISSYDEKITLNFASYELAEPKLSIRECMRESQTYSAPLYVTFHLKEEKGMKEEKVYMGEIPLMTPAGTFVVNGAERVVGSQLHRSPGICFESSIHLNGKVLFSFRIIPDRGSWVEFQYDTNDLLYAYLDRRKRRRKILATTFLRALGYGSDEDILKLFYKIEDMKLNEDLEDEAIATKVITADMKDGEVTLARAFEPLTKATIRQVIALGIKSVKVVDVSKDDSVIKSLKKDPAHDEDEALKDIYRRLRPGDPPTIPNARALLKRLFFDPKKYDLSRVGRHKINVKLGIDVKLEERTVTKEDFVAAIKYIIGLRSNEGMLDDIDHLGSRRVRTVGELLANQCRVGLARTERLVKERMTLFDANVEIMTPQKLINPKAPQRGHPRLLRPFAAFAVHGSDQPSGRADPQAPSFGTWTRRSLPRSRRLRSPRRPSVALRPDLPDRDAGRSEHRSYRIDGTYARINDFGFIETPYRKVNGGKVSDQIDYLTADQEEHFVVAQANAQMNESGKLLEDKVSVRNRGDFIEVEAEKVDYMDVSPKQLVSVAAGLIPFLEHDDANRALMGSNMQRQGVPSPQARSRRSSAPASKAVARDSQGGRRRGSRAARSPA